MTADLLTPRRTTAPSSPRRAAHARRLVPSSPRHLDFLRPPQLEHRAPRISGFWTVGFVWNSLDSLSEMSLLNGLQAIPGPFLIHAALSPQSGAQDPAVIRSKGRPRSNPAKQKPLGAPGSWQSTSEGPDGALGQTNAVFAFWQEIVDLGALMSKTRARSRCQRGPHSIAAPRGRPALDQRRLRARLAPQPRGPRKARRYGGSNAKTMISPRTRAANRMPGQPAIRRRQASEARRRRNRTAPQAPATPG